MERTYAKHRLPNYGVFDERRLFEPGDEPCLIEVDGVVVSIAIARTSGNLTARRNSAATDGADVLLVINASPFEQGKHHQRLALSDPARIKRAPPSCTWLRSVGRDELVFDGGSMVVRPGGSIAVSSPASSITRCSAIFLSAARRR